MNPERYELIASIFAQARDLTGQERERLLQQRCGADAELRREVEEYLMADDAQVRSALDRPAVSATQLRAIHGAEAEDYPAGTTVGRYTIRERIGEGGFGNVYLAEQTAPVHRMVAIKIMKAGLDTKAVLARFRQEQQALAVMDHPNVARVFDGGETNNGRSYFVMEYVDGTPVTEFCDRQRYTIHQRLALFISICDAVQHAHMKGIIHRDIKPANILVCMQQNRAVTKVIDFGIAKAINRKTLGPTIFTERGQLIGTPEYMSPEQAQIGAVAVDTRSDVYSLGVVLYELLTGVLPFEARDIRNRGFADIQTILCEVQPRTPLAGFEKQAPEQMRRIADARRSPVKLIAATLRNEVGWIVLKAIAKQPSDRYLTVQELGNDISRFLGGERVSAGAEMRLYGLRTWLRAYASILTIGTTIMVGVIALLILLLNNGESIAVWFFRSTESLRALGGEANPQYGRTLVFGLGAFLTSLVVIVVAAWPIMVPLERSLAIAAHTLLLAGCAIVCAINLIQLRSEVIDLLDWLDTRTFSGFAVLMPIAVTLVVGLISVALKTAPRRQRAHSWWAPVMTCSLGCMLAAIVGFRHAAAELLIERLGDRRVADDWARKMEPQTDAGKIRQLLQNAIELYAAEHNGEFPQVELIQEQLTSVTDRQGRLPQSAGFVLGPYLRAMPPSPSGRVGVGLQDGPGVGWVYDPSTGRIVESVR